MHKTARSVWISLSSSVILFNKWVLDTLQFRTYSMQNNIVGIYHGTLRLTETFAQTTPSS